MHLASLIHRYRRPFLDRYGQRVLPSHRRALDSMAGCQTTARLRATCEGCQETVEIPMSCGHRSCPRCQYNAGEHWLVQQRAKLLPVEYFLVTVTLPCQWRTFAWHHQRVVYNAMFQTAVTTLATFCRNDRALQATPGMTAVLHTHNRRRDYHPHIHLIVPAGGLDRRRKRWRRKGGAYLYRAENIARVFRAKLIGRLERDGLRVPSNPRRWIADVLHVGSGHNALEYLARYLYRGVIAERDIISDRDGSVTFRYTESRTGEVKTRTLPGPDFLWLILQHVLPRGFQRARHYGLLHHRARVLLQRVQLLLAKRVTAATPKPRWTCRRCHQPMKHIRHVDAPTLVSRGPPVTA